MEIRAPRPRELAYKIPNPPAGFDNLSPEEQIDYVQSLWARVAATPEKVPVPDWHLAILDQRLKEHDDE